MRKADQLRTRAAATGLVPAEVLASTPDDMVIEAYITCSCCGQRGLDVAHLAESIRCAATADEFLDAALVH